MFDTIIIVPYRDRLQHMKYFIENYCPILKKNVPNSKVVFIEQDFSNNYFNRGMLLNIGFDLYKNETKFYITHDIDIIPNEKIIQELFNINNYDVVKIFTGHHMSLGGICKFSKESLFQVNGFPNYIWGWGIEDRVMGYRYNIFKKKIKERIYGIGLNTNDFGFLPHKHNRNNTHPNNYSSKNNISDIEDEIYNSNNIELQKQHIMSSGLNNLQYKILEKINISDYIELIKVSI
tara:strand:+ start:630 stop:1331 length:702 start_codon:yes stop_codon:yes gene_type:complete